MGTAITNNYDKRLLEVGFDRFTVSDQNEFIIQLAKRLNLPLTDITRGFILDYHKTIKEQHFSNLAEEEIIKGFVSPTTGYTYRTNRDDQLNMLGQFVFAKEFPDMETIYWKVEEEGTQMPHSREDFLQIVMEGFEHKLNILTKLDQLRQQIREATSDEELVTINWE